MGWRGRSGRRNAHSYRSTDSTFSIKKKDTTSLDVPQERVLLRRVKKTVWSHSVQCSNCKGENPEVARFLYALWRRSADFSQGCRAGVCFYCPCEHGGAYLA